MKRIRTAILLCGVIAEFCTGVLSGQNLLKNGSFDLFANGEPTGWTTSNISGMLMLASPSGQSRNGKGGIKLEVKVFYGTKLAGTATQDNIPISARQVTLTGYYTLTSVRGDKAYVSVTLMNESGSTIGVADMMLEPARTFKQFTLPLDVSEAGGGTKAKVGIAIMPGENEQLHEGTTAVFDDFVLKGTTDR